MRKYGREIHWGLFDLLLVYLGILLAGLLFSRYGYGVYLLLLKLGIPETELTFFTAAYLAQFLVTVLLILFFTVFIHHARLEDLGIRTTRSENYLKYGLLGGWLLMTLVIALSVPINYWKPDMEPQVFEEMLRSVQGIPQFLGLFVMGAVLAPLSEELFYRGMMYPVFRRYLGPLGGAVITGLIFGLAHWDLWRTIPLAVGGAVLCYFYEKTGSILVPMLAHGVWNGTMAIIVYFTMLNI